MIAPSENGHGASRTVHFDKAKTSRLRKAYIVAKAENLDVFIFEGSELEDRFK